MSRPLDPRDDWWQGQFQDDGAPNRPSTIPARKAPRPAFSTRRFVLALLLGPGLSSTPPWRVRSTTPAGDFPWKEWEEPSGIVPLLRLSTLIAIGIGSTLAAYYWIVPSLSS